MHSVRRWTLLLHPPYQSNKQLEPWFFQQLKVQGLQTLRPLSWRHGVEGRGSLKRGAVAAGTRLHRGSTALWTCIQRQGV